MTDVRLTALNPADSQVYPVACNDKGELILEQDAAGDLDVVGNISSTSWPTKGYVLENDANGGSIGINQVSGASGTCFVVARGGTQVVFITALGAGTFAGGIESSGAGLGIIMKSPNGTRYRLTVDDSGNLSTTAI